MNAIGNMHEMRFSNMSILSHIVCYTAPLTIIIALVIKKVGFQRSDRLCVTYLQGIMVISKIKYDFFYLNFLYFRLKILLLHN